MSQRLNIELVDLPLLPFNRHWLLYEHVVCVKELVRGFDVTVSLRFLSLWLLFNDVVFLLLVDFSDR